MSWYVINTRYGDEERTGQMVVRLGHQAYCPTVKVDRRLQKKKDKDLPMFPCYFFAYLPDGTDFSEVKRIPGVTRILTGAMSKDGRCYPKPINEFVESLRAAQQPIQPKYDYYRGDKVVDIDPKSAFYLREALVHEAAGDRIKILHETLAGVPIYRTVTYDEVEPV